MASTTAFVIWTEASIGAIRTASFDASAFIESLLGVRDPRGASCEDVQHLPEARREAVHLLERVVHVEGRPRGRGHVQPFHQGLRAVVSGANRDISLVE